jgi:hypothetical protein
MVEVRLAGELVEDVMQGVKVAFGGASLGS